MALPVATRLLRFSPALSLRLTYQSTGSGERRVREWMDESAQRSGAALTEALAGASPVRSGTLAQSMRYDYGFPTLFTGTSVEYARYQRNIGEALTQGAAIVDRQFRTQTRGILFALRYTGLWTIRLAGIVVTHAIRGTIRTTQTVFFRDLYTGYALGDSPYGATFGFKMPDFTVEISGRPKVA